MIGVDRAPAMLAEMRQRFPDIAVIMGDAPRLPMRARAVDLVVFVTTLEFLEDPVRALGVRTFPTETYCFLADCAPHDAGAIAARLTARHILVKPLNDKRLGPSDLLVTTALPKGNAHVLALLRDWR